MLKIDDVLIRQALGTNWGADSNDKALQNLINEARLAAGVEDATWQLALVPGLANASQQPFPAPAPPPPPPPPPTLLALHGGGSLRGSIVARSLPAPESTVGLSATQPCSLAVARYNQSLGDMQQRTGPEHQASLLEVMAPLHSQVEVDMIAYLKAEAVLRGSLASANAALATLTERTESLSSASRPPSTPPPPSSLPAPFSSLEITRIDRGHQTGRRKEPACFGGTHHKGRGDSRKRPPSKELDEAGLGDGLDSKEEEEHSIVIVRVMRQQGRPGAPKGLREQAWGGEEALPSSSLRTACPLPTIQPPVQPMVSTHVQACVGVLGLRSPFCLASVPLPGQKICHACTELLSLMAYAMRHNVGAGGVSH